MKIEEKTYEELLELDIKYIKKVLEENKNDITYDTFFGGWCFGEEPIRDYLYYNEDTYLNPKELEGYIDEIIEDEIKIGVKWEK